MSFIIPAALAFVLIIFFVKASKNKSKFGINLKRTYCPVCNTKQPIIRIPRSINQFLFGGTTCPKCHANLDKYGNVIQ
jgi:RNase P subunit RPR2